MSKNNVKKEYVAFQGNRGAYSEAAAVKYFGEDIDLLPLYSFDDVFEKVNKGEVTSGIVPIENSFTGPIYHNYDLLLENELWICGETHIRINHQLIAHPGVKFEDIKKVYSHPQGISQCQAFLKNNPQVEQIPSYDTAGSVQIIRDNKWMDSAAIASKYAAEFYKMAVLKDGIEDIEQNRTRFLILKKNKDVSEKANKTSIVFSMDNTPGSLFKCLGVFALRDIGLSRIESRPLRGKPWQYFFYIDIEDSIKNERCLKAMDHLQEMTNYFKILGSYPEGLNL